MKMIAHFNRLTCYIWWGVDEVSQNPVKQLKNGQQDSVEQIVDAHYDAIYRYCYFHVQQKNEAEDLTQDVFMHFIWHIDSYDNQGTPRAYLMKIAKNICINWAKKKKPDFIEAVEDYSVTATGIVSVEDYLPNFWYTSC